MAGEPRKPSRRDVLKYTGAGVGTAALAGCKERPTPTVVEGAEGLKGKTIKTGVLTPSPGDFPVGTGAVNSAELAAKHINQNGGIAGADVEVFVGDTELSPATAKEKYVELVKKEGTHVNFFSGILDQVLLACYPSMKEFQNIIINTGSAGPRPARLVSKRYDEFKYHFRVGPINMFDLGKAQLELLDTYNKDIMGWETAAVLVENTGPFDPLFGFLKENLSEYLDIKMFKRTSSGTTNWTPIYDEVESANPDVALTYTGLTSTAATKQWYTQKRSFEMGGILVYPQLFTFWQSVSGACRYSFTMNAITPQTTNTPRTQPFMKAYREEYTPEDATIPHYPVYNGPITYDAYRIYKQAVENYLKEEGGNTIPTGDDLVPYLEDIVFEKGVIIPQFQFTPKDAKYAHDPQWPSMKETGVPIWQQWQKDPEVRKGYGVQHSFAPKQNKTSHYAVPHWIDRETPESRS